MFVEAGVHPSLDEYCQHQTVYGKVNVLLPPPPPYHRKIWDYPMAIDRAIIDAITSIDWQSKFTGIGPEEMTSVFTNELPSFFTTFIPNRIAKFNDKDPPWVTNAVKTAIKRKKRVYKNVLRRGRRQVDWELFKKVRNDTSRLVSDAKETYYSNLGRRLSDPTQGVKAYWAVLNKLVNKKKL